MNLRQIEIFCAVMRCGTTTAAAYELTVSQPAISNTIKHLEAQLGISLFNRIGNRLVPTSEARALYQEAQPLIVKSQSISRRVQDLRDSRVGNLRVVSTHPLGDAVVPRVIKAFLKNRQAVRIHLEISRMDGVIEAVESGLADVGIAIEPDARPMLNLTPYVFGRMVCVFPPDHPFQKKKIITVQDLFQESLVGLSRDSRLGAILAKTFSDAGALYDPIVEVRHGVTACSLVENGVGVAIVDEFSATSKAQYYVKVRAFEPTIRITGTILTAKDRPVSRLATRFIDVLKRHKIQRYV